MKDNHTKKHIWASIMILIIVVLDQVCKFVARSNLSDSAPKDFIKGFIQFHYAENEGIAFSMFSGARWIFAALTFAVCLAILIYMFKNKCSSLWLYWSLGVTVSGGIGNLIDRVHYGFVIDFIEPVFISFAIFNIADCAVTLGAISLIACLAYDAFKADKKEKMLKGKEDNNE